ncbi:MAG: MurR/RpiR family transcriptional regulator [Janthinobacterium lividum]
MKTTLNTELTTVGARTGVRERIAEVYDDLGPVERRVGDFVLDHAEDLAGYTGAELAVASATSKATVSRFFRRLGFDSFAQARADARSQRARGELVGGVPDSGDAVATHLDQDRRNLVRAGENLEALRLREVAATLANARRVLVVGWRNSYPVAVHLREQLLQARDDVSLAPQPGQTLAEEVADLTAADALVVVGFRRRPPMVAALLDAAAASGVPCVLLADASARPLRADHRVEVPVDGPGAFDSYAAAMAVVTILAEAVLTRRGRAGRERVSAVAHAHARLVELEEAPDAGGAVPAGKRSSRR